MTVDRTDGLHLGQQGHSDRGVSCDDGTSIRGYANAGNPIIFGRVRSESSGKDSDGT